MGCKKCAEGHGCGCGTKRADTATVEEPDWIPDGDGRAIGQQDFAINLSPLHADTVGTPSPTFDEGITGQDGPSNEPTNATFEARDMHKAPNTADTQKARRAIVAGRYAKDTNEIIYDKYMVNQQYYDKGNKQNRFYYTAMVETTNARGDPMFYALSAHGGIGANHVTVNNILGKDVGTKRAFSNYGEAWNLIKKQEQKKLNRRPSWKEYRVVSPDEIFGADQTLAEIEGPTAEATSGGLHSPSSFDMTWEDGMGQSSASIPPNEIAWAETSGIPTWVKYGAGIALILAGGSFLKAKKSEQKAADNLRNVVNKRKGCGCGSKSFNARSMNDPIAEDQDRQNCVANGCEWVEADPMSRSTSYCKCHHATAKEGGIQNQLDGGVTFQSEFSVGQINPVEVEGQNDIYGAEEYKLSTPQMSQPNWGPQTTYRQNPRRNLKMW